MESAPGGLLLAVRDQGRVYRPPPVGDVMRGGNLTPAIGVRAL